MKDHLAVVFPGQGSQSVGMLSELAERHDIIQQTFEEASEALGYDLWSLSQQGPAEQLNQTIHTQPALLVAGVAVWRLWCEQDGPKPKYFAGHSLGEYTALVCAEAMSFAQGVKLVAKRGELMQQAVPEGDGAMAVVLGLDDEVVVALCDEHAQGDVLSAVNFNAPGQVVIAGHAAAVARGVDAAKTKGARRAMALPVSVPSHCALMKPAADALEVYLNDILISAPKTPVVNNVDLKAEIDPAKIRNALVRQLYQPVPWQGLVSYLVQAQVEQIVECGPGKVLCGLNKRIDKTLQLGATETPALFIDTITAAK